MGWMYNKRYSSIVARALNVINILRQRRLNCLASIASPDSIIMGGRSRRLTLREGENAVGDCEENH